MLETLRERLLSVQQDFTSGWVFGGDGKGAGSWAGPRSWVSARDAASVPSPDPGPALSRASHPRPAEESNELSGVGPAAQSNLGPNGLALTRARGPGWSGDTRDPSRRHPRAGGGASRERERASPRDRGLEPTRALELRRDTCPPGPRAAEAPAGVGPPQLCLARAEQPASGLSWRPNLARLAASSPFAFFPFARF